MDRLTKRDIHGTAYLANVKDNEQAVEASKHTCKCLYESWQSLAAYEDAEEQGRLVVLPCKVGDKVFKVDFGDGYSEPSISAHIIRGFKHTAYTGYPFCDIERFGITIFYTREEAEAALAAREGGGT